MKAAASFGKILGLYSCLFIFKRPMTTHNLGKVGLRSEFKEALLLTTRNERNAEGSVSSLGAATISGIKDDRVMTKTFAEGSNAVGSLGFVGFTSHVCTSRF